MCSASAGERSIYVSREFARLKEQWLKVGIDLKLPNGLSSYDTVRRVPGILNQKQFQDVFIRLVEQELSIPSSNYVSLDEKNLRGSGEKTNEIPSSKKLIGAMKIKDDVISAAAMP